MRRATIALLTVLLMGCSAGAQKASADEKAPDTFKVNFDTSRGPVVIEVNRADAPVGADRLYTLVKNNYFDGARFFRVVPGFVVQFGLAGDPAVIRKWDMPIQDETPKTSNVRGTLTFAASQMPNSRTTQMFINLGDNQRLDGIGFAPIGKVVSGMEFVDMIYSGDGENPQQELIQAQGNAYLQKQFPNLDYIKTARIVP
jgi:peptidyl-prolyl cis-trans isomerase A (cyclophilin A)